MSMVLPAQLKNALIRAARTNGRSVAAECAARIEFTFDWPVRIGEMKAALQAVLRDEHHHDGGR